MYRPDLLLITVEPRKAVMIHPTSTQALHMNHDSGFLEQC